MDRTKAFLKGAKDGIPIGLAYFAVSFTFGIMAASGGISPWDAGLISLTNLTSAGQFAALEVIFADGGYFELFLTQLIINLRYLLMSLSLSQKVSTEEPRFHRFLYAFGITDEIFGISIAQPGKVSAFYHYGAMSVAIPGWTLGTIIGAISGNLLPDFIVSALSIAIYGMFIAIVIPPSKKNKNILYAVLGAMGLSTIFSLTPVLNKISAGFSIILITVLVSALMALVFPITEETEGSETVDA